MEGDKPPASSVSLSGTGDTVTKPLSVIQRASYQCLIWERIYIGGKPQKNAAAGIYSKAGVYEY